MTNIILRGCNGKMGSLITQMVEEDENAVIVAGIDVSKTKETKYPVFYRFSQCNVPADVIIDFTSTVNVREMFVFASSNNKGIV